MPTLSLVMAEGTAVKVTQTSDDDCCDDDRYDDDCDDDRYDDDCDDDRYDDDCDDDRYDDRYDDDCDDDRYDDDCDDDRYDDDCDDDRYDDDCDDDRYDDDCDDDRYDDDCDDDRYDDDCDDDRYDDDCDDDRYDDDCDDDRYDDYYDDCDGNDGRSGNGPLKASFTLSARCADGLYRARAGVPVSFRDTSRGTVATRTWSFGDGSAGSSSPSPRHTWTAPGFYTVSLTVSGQGSTSTTSRKVLVEARNLTGSCAADSGTRCLRASRFSVAVDWWTQQGAAQKAGRVVREGTDDSGLYWFFSPANWELLLKVLDGCSLNGNVWVFGASATTLGYSIRVTDTVTGAMKEYRNEPGRRSSAITDTAAFPGACSDSTSGAGSSASSPPLGSDPVVARPLPVVAAPSPAESGGCTPAGGTLCLQDGRYAVSVDWTSLEGDSGTANVARPRADDSGLFWFFSETNWELLVKVLDGCTNNGHHWVFATSATDIGFVLQVRDTVTGKVRQYRHTAGAPARALADVTAFPEACAPP